jgi:methionyl-tRNA synthetase
VPTPARAEEELAALAREVTAECETALNEFRFNSALEAVWRLVGRMNRYIEEKTPWTLVKQGQTEELAVVLYSCLEAVRVITTLLAPTMPAAAKALWKQIGLETTTDTARWADASGWGLLPPETRVSAPQPLFPRIQNTTKQERPNLGEATTEEERGRRGASAAPPQAKRAPSVHRSDERRWEEKRSGGETVLHHSTTPSPQPPTISMDDFMKIDLRVASVLAAESVPNATKLLKLTLEVGEETRTILAGIAEMYQPEELVGRQVVVVTNLAPRKMRGIESQGMLLAADVEGQAILLQPETKVPSGSRVR